jgi:hypothetical protein
VDWTVNNQPPYKKHDERDREQPDEELEQQFEHQADDEQDDYGDGDYPEDGDAHSASSISSGSIV